MLGIVIAGRNIGVGVALVFFVTLVTFVFSFLGTILCGAVVGMMVGSTKCWRWRFVLVSLVFPAAILASLHVRKSDLALRDSFLMSAVCFGVFWLTYFLAFGLFYLEKPAGRSSAGLAAKEEATAKQSQRARVENAGVDTSAAAAPLRATTASLAEPGLAELQGTWARETTAPDGRPCKAVIEFARGELALRIVGFDGQVRSVLRSDVKLERHDGVKILKVIGPQAESLPVFSDRFSLPCIWVYRVAHHTLTIAWNFEETARGPEPTIETYVKAPGSADTQTVGRSGVQYVREDSVENGCP